MTLLQSAVFDIEEMGRAIAGWKGQRVAAFDGLGEVPGVRVAE
jgi:hypothetical protein